MFARRVSISACSRHDGARTARRERSRYAPGVTSLEDRYLLSTAGVADGSAVRPIAVEVAASTDAGHSLQARRNKVSFPGGSVITNPGGTRVRFPGGFVVANPGGTVVKFPGGFISIPHGVITFPGGSVNFG